MKPLLFLSSVVLAVIFFPIGFVYALIVNPTRFGGYLLKIALAVDQSGNVVMRELFNHVLITKKSKHKFGENEDFTISYVLGINMINGTLSGLGNKLNDLLNWLDKDHSLKAVKNQQ